METARKVTLAMEAAVKKVEEEISLVGRPSGKDAALAQAGSMFRSGFKDRGVSEATYSARFEAQLRAMKWRFQIQDKFYLAMERLRDEGLLDPRRALRDPVNWYSLPHRVWDIIHVLSSFALVRECEDSEYDLQGMFGAPVEWLALLIARTTTDFVKTVSFLKTTELLGHFVGWYDTTIVSKIIRRDISTGRTEKRIMLPHRIGFWLPQDPSGILPFGQHRALRYWELKRVYEGWLGEGSWDRDEDHEIIPEWLYD